MQQLNFTCDLGQRVKQRSPPEGKAKVDQEIGEMKRDWEKMNEDISICNSKLDTLLVKWVTYEETVTVLLKWLTETETELKMGVEPKTELLEKKAQLEKCKVKALCSFCVKLHHCKDFCIITTNEPY